MTVVRVVSQLFWFGWHEALSCSFAVGVFLSLALTRVVPLPIHRYDAMLISCLALAALLWALRLETAADLRLGCVFHLMGLGMELVKVRMGSWSYPEEALTKVGGVPLYSGFMYAAVGSYICQAWRRLDVSVTGYRPRLVAVVAGAIYLNFLTHHWLPDLRWPLTAALLAALHGARVHFRVRDARYWLPMSVSLAAVGFFLWVAENVATFLGAWSYPHQLEAWRMVHPAKFGAWSLLVSVAFVLVAWERSRAEGGHGWLGRIENGHPASPQEQPHELRVLHRQADS